MSTTTSEGLPTVQAGTTESWRPTPLPVKVRVLSSGATAGPGPVVTIIDEPEVTDEVKPRRRGRKS